VLQFYVCTNDISIPCTLLVYSLGVQIDCRSSLLALATSIEAYRPPGWSTSFRICSSHCSAVQMSQYVVSPKYSIRRPNHRQDCCSGGFHRLIGFHRWPFPILEGVLTDYIGVCMHTVVAEMKQSCNMNFLPLKPTSLALVNRIYCRDKPEDAPNARLKPR
jgi:hypothetical protein